jgi:polyisoprenoid-binding protein YceI
MTETAAQVTAQATAATRIVDGAELPAAGTWKVDPGHAEVGFVGRHFMLTKVRGRFTGVDAVVQIGADPAETTVEVTIDMTTVTSGDSTRDNHLKSADLFDVEQYPTATFRSTGIGWDGLAGSMTGDLTIKGTTRRVTLEVEYLGYAQDPWGSDRTVFSARGRINREDWGVTWNMPLARGGLLVSTEIGLELEIELIRQP